MVHRCVRGASGASYGRISSIDTYDFLSHAVAAVEAPRSNAATYRMAARSRTSKRPDLARLLGCLLYRVRYRLPHCGAGAFRPTLAP